MTALERRYLLYAAVFALAGIAWLLGACATMPETRFVTGVITQVKRDQSKEANCGIVQMIRDRSACDAPPICCSYRLTVVDSTGHRERFWAFWPRRAEGLKEGQSARFRLHAQRIYEFPCSMYGCRSTWDYALQSDEDVSHP